jgi:hypothetical protein
MIVKLAQLMTIIIAGLLLWAAFIDNEFHGREDWLVFTLFFSCCLLNLVALSERKLGNNKLFDIWPFLVIKRMAMEERRKIKELQKD